MEITDRKGAIACLVIQRVVDQFDGGVNGNTENSPMEVDGGGQLVLQKFAWIGIGGPLSQQPATSVAFT